MEYKEDPSSNEDAFKIAFKYYKQKASMPSLDNVIDFSDPGKLQGKVTEVTQSLVVGGVNGSGPQNMLHRSKWSAYAINSVPGLYFVTGAFSADHQKYWCQKCMQQYCKSPYRTNLDIFHPKNEVDAMWDETKQILRGCDEPMELQSWKKTPIWKLRWSTLGYHYGWSNKLYARKNKSAFPGGLSQMCNYISTSLGFSDFTPEAAIVNYYHAGSALSPHVDVSEVDLQFPLLSVSFGLPAIFLIGDDTRETEPTAILIRSGYILVMSGKSRTAYHALPRVLAAERENTSVTMVLLENDAFLIELTSLYQKTRNAGSVNLTMKKYDGRTKPRPKMGKKKRVKPPSALEPIHEDLCLIRASNGKKKISTVVSAKDINRFQMAYTSVLRANFDALKKRERKKTKATTKATAQ